MIAGPKDNLTVQFAILSITGIEFSIGTNSTYKIVISLALIPSKNLDLPKAVLGSESL
jgi:hypothetical protein